MKKRQGTSDGLCGIYALAKIMHQTDSKSNEFDLRIVELLEALPDKSFTPKKIGAKGFGVKELRDALDRTQSGRSNRLEARFFRQNREKVRTFGLDRLFDEGGALVAHEDGPGHWLAVTKKKKCGEYKVYDPYPKRRVHKFTAAKTMQESRLIVATKSFWKKFDAQTY